MSARPRRLIIVRRGETTLFEFLQKQFTPDIETLIIWDRRTAERRQVGAPWIRTPEERRRGERRFPENAVALNERGFFVTREMWRPTDAEPGDPFSRR